MQKLQLSRKLDMSYLDIDDLGEMELDVLMAYLDGESHGERLRKRAEAESKRVAS